VIREGTRPHKACEISRSLPAGGLPYQQWRDFPLMDLQVLSSAFKSSMQTHQHETLTQVLKKKGKEKLTSSREKWMFKEAKETMLTLWLRSFDNHICKG